jgi:probable rRNA maturation factor
VPAKIQIRIEDPAGKPHAKALRRAVASALSACGLNDHSLTIVLTDSDRLRQLNRRFAGEDHPTDVLSFPDGSRDPDTGEVYLGDVLIAVSVAGQQARQAGHQLADELTLLAVHGTLHLAGYNHANPEERAMMWRMQDAILGGLNCDIRSP